MAIVLTLIQIGWGQSNSSEFSIHSVELISSEQARLTLDISPETSYQFRVSTNLLEWSPTTLTPVSFEEDTATYRIDINPERPTAMFQVEYRPLPTAPELLAQLNGPGEEPAIEHLPEAGVPFEDELEEVSMAGNLPVSLTHLLVHLKSTTTVSDLNGALAAENLLVAGSLPLMNLIILRTDAIANTGQLLALAERLKATSLFNEVAFNLGESPPRTFESSQRLVPSRAGRQRGFINWTWEPSLIGTGSGGNNALEMSRIPQLWNWMDHAYRQRELLGGHEVAVLEFAFNPHQDLHTNVVLQTTSNTNLTQSSYDHGIAVTGIIAAKRNSGGTDGVTPLPDKVRGIPFLQNNTSTHSYASVRLTQLSELLSGPNPPKIINISSGMPWYNIGDPTTTTDPDSGSLYAEWMDRLGSLYACSFESLNQYTGRSDYLIVCSAGNDDGIDAAYNSPYANVACRPELQIQAPQFLTVENVTKDRITSQSSNFDASGAGDSASAGGTDITVLSGPADTNFRLNRSGTSYAAPLVTGLASFLWSLEPSLTIYEMKSLLLGPETTFEVQEGERGNLVDGYSAALAIDLLRENTDLHRALVDVDDGTLDGNLREKIIHYSEDPNRIHTVDGRRGDGVIDMKDFRAFRDAWLDATDEAEWLDGQRTHFKRDLNFDGLVFDQPVSPEHPAPYDIRSTAGEPLAEAVYSRYDFNGNGRLDEENQSASPPAQSLSPVRVDPDRSVERRSVSQGILRDIDVLLFESLWEQNEENVVLDDAPPYPDLLPFNWTTNDLSTLYVSDLQSFDLHIDMAGGNADAQNDNYFEHPYYPVQEGLEIRSYALLTKGRLGAWQGVITVPYDVIFDIPTVSVRYRESVGDEFHSYDFSFLGQKGEDLGLSIGFDELGFASNNRQFFGSYDDDSSNPVSAEVIAKRPGRGFYSRLFIPLDDATSEEIKNRARDAAVAALGGRLRFPTAFPGTPKVEAIYRTDGADDGVFVEIYGIEAMFNVIDYTTEVE